MFWIAYVAAFLYYFYLNKGIVFTAPKVNLILTLVGMDGYLNYWIPGFYILGEWFLGCIILLYVCFPLLRKLVIEKPLILLICVVVLYFGLVNFYPFKMNMGRNFIMRVPDMLVGMYFIQYIKKVKIYHFIPALIISVILLFFDVNINHMYELTLSGISLFFVLVFISNFIKWDNIQRIISVISKYSFAIFLTHHVIIYHFLGRFKGKELSTTETYTLFLLTCIVILIISIYLQKASDKVTGSLKRILAKSNIS